ncbi:hypothetical protein EV715DRAFT_271495 [Schizophyllum commune]
MHRAGYHPSFQEADSILERVRDLEAAEPRMIDELRRLEACIAHARRQTALGKALLLLSPWRRIPPEIWSKIFILSLLACAEVCYSWRVVALNTSELWTDIIISLNTGLPRPNLEALAGNQLLRLRAQDIGMPWAEPYYNSLLWQLIGQQSRRWKTIELLDVHPLAYAKLNGLPYTNLRSLLLKVGDEDTAMTQVHAFDDAPDLRSLELRDSVDFELSPSWRLHTLEIAYVPPAHGHALNKPFLCSILPCSQTLRKLVLDAEIVGDRAPVHPTIFPSLEELELTDGEVYIMEKIIRPSNLHTLVLRQDILDREDTTNTLDISTAVQHALRTLVLQSIQTTGIIRILQRLPRLTRLEVEDSYWTDLIEPGDVIELAAALQRDRTRPEPHAPDAEVRMHAEHATSSHHWTRRAVEVSC